MERRDFLELSLAAMIAWSLPTDSQAGADFDTPLKIPSKLPPPKNKKWLEKLRRGLSLEIMARDQYEFDHARFLGSATPYHNLIREENNHIEWICNLLEAYGLTADVARLPIVKHKSVKEAFALGRKIEKELFPFYAWLMGNAEDPDSKKVMHTILHQTLMHYLWLGGPPEDISAYEKT